MSQIRAFLAIDLNDDLKPKINKLINEFKQTNAKIKFVELENLHLTLKFFGDINIDVIQKLKTIITNVISEFEGFEIKIKSCGAFPNKNNIRVMWVGIEDDAILKELHDRLDEEFIRLCFDKDKKFSTHLTIGRMKSPKNKQEVKEVLEKFNDFEVGAMEVSKISLKKSTLTPSGPIYEDIEIFEL